MKNKKKGIFSFFTESYHELKKVVWPTRLDVAKKTAIVIVSMVVIAAIFAAMDYGLSKGVEFLINLK